MTKYPEDCFKAFIVFDPNRSISDDDDFRDGFEKKGMCKVHVIR